MSWGVIREAGTAKMPVSFNRCACHDQSGSEPKIRVSTDAGNDWDHDFRFGLPSDRSQKTVALAANGFQKPGIVARIVQGLAQLPHRSVQRVVKLDERIVRPQFADGFPPW